MHCVFENNENSIQIRVGQHNIQDPQPFLQVEKIIKRSDYDSVNQYNDIALIKLKQPVKYSKIISPVCLPSSDVKDPQGLFVAGWGRTDESGPVSNALLEVNLPNYSLAQCKNKYKGLITDKHICAGGNEGEDACQGDSGGPLTARINNRVNVVGIVSWGMGNLFQLILYDSIII